MITPTTQQWAGTGPNVATTVAERISVFGMLSESIALQLLFCAAAGFVLANNKNVTTTTGNLESVLSNFIESPNHLQLVRL
jgi:hypothetical protein